jgi:CubicO group peptidase (beta-lactamase class C family)
MGPPSRRRLLSHQAGLLAVRRILPADAIYDWGTMAAALAGQEPWWEPGTRHGYHALTFGFLVGELIRRVSGRSVGTFFRDEVAGPLDADFFIGLPAAEEARVSDLFGSLAPPAPAAGGPEIPGPLGQFLRDMTDPTTLAGAAFNNPPGRNDRVNTRAHPGAGGSIGMADPDAKVGFGYVMNNMKLGLVGGPGAFAVLRTFFELL